jgi:hypothetical protein
VVVEAFDVDRLFVEPVNLVGFAHLLVNMYSLMTAELDQRVKEFTGVHPERTGVRLVSCILVDEFTSRTGIATFGIAKINDLITECLRRIAQTMEIVIRPTYFYYAHPLSSND